MENQQYKNQVAQATVRYLARQAQRSRTEKLIQEQKYLSIDDPLRIQKFLSRRGFSDYDVHNLTKHPLPIQQLNPVSKLESKLLEMIIGDNNLMSVCFLQKGVNTAPATTKIHVRGESNQEIGSATGFMVSPRLLLTNYHVLGNRDVLKNSILEFNYQTKLDGSLEESVQFLLNPDLFYCATEDLDFVLIGVKPESINGQSIAKYGWNKLIEDEGKAIVGQYINIIQHSSGNPKEICIRNNQLKDIVDDFFLHYSTDTEPGSSGSGLYNDQWELIGLHHAAIEVPPSQVTSPDGNTEKYQNEGIRISAIIKHLKAQKLTSQEQSLFQECFSSPPPPGSSFSESKSSDRGVANTHPLVNEDGSVSWTIPLSVNIQLGSDGKIAAAPVVAKEPLSTKVQEPASHPVTSSLPNNAAEGEDEADDILRQARKELSLIPHVIGVEMGYKIERDSLSDQQAIVVTLDGSETKQEAVRLPDQYRGMPVERLGPGLRDILTRARNRSIRELFIAGSQKVEEIVYTPSDTPLVPVKEPMKANFHVSPEEGWHQLKDFIAGAERELVIGMYDFGAPHILDALVALKTKPHFKISMAIQKGQSLKTGNLQDETSNPKSNDLEDDKVVKKLRSVYKDRFDYSWVKIGIANGWVASSYHIKVAVRDENSIWLSSGNWQSSNQPDIEGQDISEIDLQNSYNREWHVIVENKSLAKMYRDYILHDITENRKLQDFEMALLPPLALFQPKGNEILEAALPYHPFAPKLIEETLHIVPLLTPDNYFEQAIQLINRAEKSIWIENQSFNALSEKSTNAKLEEFLTAIYNKQEDGIQIKVIFRLFIKSDAIRNIMQLKKFGFKAQNIKVMKNCHTKGMIVDRKVVMLGSQNISEQGISVNRDASLIIYHEEVAKYFAQIFSYDWDRCTNVFSNRNEEALFLQPGEKVPAGFDRLSWKEIIESL